jgi:tetratricopeptide (TPR) repeat protein
MEKRRGRRVPLALAVMGGLAFLETATSARAQIPDTFTNLQVLPRDTPRPELVGMMRVYASALGVRCAHCHVGADAPDLKGADFASDAKEEKRTARLMMKMVRAINDDHLSKAVPPSAPRVECVTCHRGMRSPRTLEAELTEPLTSKGAEAAVARYRELRTSFYGRGGYDFGQGTLNKMGEGLLRGKKPAEALTLLSLNVEFFPEAPWTLYLLGEAHRALGHREDALAAYRKSAALEPQNPMAAQRLKEMTASPSPAP